jgi:hypothetical protein
MPGIGREGYRSCRKIWLSVLYFYPCRETKMSGVVAYFLLLGGATGVALALFFGLKAVKLI